MTTRVVCLCGSTRFHDTFVDANRMETLKGNIVLAPGVFGPIDEETKQMLDKLHRQRIDMADEVLVIDVDGYIGESTRGEIHYAETHGKHIRYWSQEREGV